MRDYARQGYARKSVVQMVLKEGYTDRNVIADELGVTRKYVTNIIGKLESPLREAIEARLK